MLLFLSKYQPTQKLLLFNPLVPNPFTAPPATRTLLMDVIVVISTSGRSHASTVTIPVDFVNLSVPPDGKSRRCVLATGSLWFGSSVANSRRPVANPIAATSPTFALKHNFHR